MTTQDRGVDRWEHVTCPGCGCVCDDLSLAFRDGELVEFAPRCAMGERWFRTHGQAATSVAEIHGQTASLSEALAQASEILDQSDYPLIYGLSRSATAGQRAAVALAEKLRGAIDTTASLCHGPSIMAIQEVGEVTCTLGEVRNRADLVIFWGCNPAVSHPRHAERYSVFASGRHRHGGRSDRTIVMVGDADQVDAWRLDESDARPDLVVPIAPGQDFEAIAILRALLRGGVRSAADARRADDRRFAAAARAASPELLRLLDCMRSCQYGAVFFGLGITETPMWDGRSHPPIGHINVAALLQLVAELNRTTRFTARRMRMHAGVSGADNVLCWQTGYPFAVDMSRGFPRYNPGEFSANELLSRGDADACLLVGAETVPYFSAVARRRLREIPTIVLDYPGVPLEFTPTVRFTTCVYGLHARGTVYRMDNVPVGLAAPLTSDAPTDEQVLLRLLG